MNPPRPYRVSPSDIARFFFHDCERFLRFRSTTPAERQAVGLPERAFDQSPLMQAILATGNRWEEEVVLHLIHGQVMIAPGEGELNQRRWGLEQTVELLRTAVSGSFLYQPTLRAGSLFYQRNGLPPDLLFPDNHPDLVAILPEGSGRLLRIIDVKRGTTLQLAHRVQVYLYALELQALLEENSITNTRVDLDQGGVWLGGLEQPELFDLAALRPHVEQFLRHDLGRILRQPPRDASWHLESRCEWCDYFPHCYHEMEQADDLSRLSNLTRSGKRHLLQLGIRTVTDLGPFLEQPDADEQLARCASLAGERHYLHNKVVALQTNQPVIHGAASPALPRGENIALFLTLQREPLGQSTYLAGLLVNVRADLQATVFDADTCTQLFSPDRKAQPVVLVADKPDRGRDVRREFITLLIRILRQVHAFNEAQEWKDRLTLQTYTHTEREKQQLVVWLLETLEDEDLAEQAMQMLFLFQGPDLLLTDRHPGTPVPYPVVVLANALGRLLALPVDCSYTLPEALTAMGSSFHYARKERFHYPLGHGLRADAIHAAWHLQQPTQVEAIRQEGRLYLYALRSLLMALRSKASNQLMAWPAKFALPRVASITDPLLSRLAFFARYESVLGCLHLRDERSEARAVQVVLGTTLELEVVEGYTFRVVGDPLLDLEEDPFPSWLLVRDNDEGRQAQLEFRDYNYRNYPSRDNYGPRPAAALAIVGVTEITPDELGFPSVVRFSKSKPFAGGAPSAGERFLLYPRFQDYNSDRIIDFLEECDLTDGGLYRQVLSRPRSVDVDFLLVPAVAEAARALQDRLAFTPSQAEAYEAITRRRIVAVWGPPGTGKTYFVATALLGLLAAHARAGQPLRVLVTAFTHNAIENVLRKITQRQADLPDLPDLGVSVAIAKAKEWQGAGQTTETVLAEEDLPAWLHRHSHVVVGATVYACLKARRAADLMPFDLVIVDEASQVRVPEAAIPLYLVANLGRVVLAGDDMQLPPIVQGEYPDPKASEPILHRSIFELVRTGVEPGSPVVQQLGENHRMNDVLTRFVRELVYGPRYVCFDQHVASRRLPFHPASSMDPLLSACLDPAYPMVMVIIEGVQASSENPVEADLVARLIFALRQGLHDQAGQLYKEDSEFFRHGVFIVSPHRAQNRAIRRSLRQLRDWQWPPFVDTVDKMQGQEADAVVVSYGVSDPEYALREANFIYSLNRLNVSITRARSKSIVCLPRPLLDASPHILDLPDAARGLAFMRGLVRMVEEQADPLFFDLGNGAHANVLRADR